MAAEVEKRKLIDLRVVDLRGELEKRGIDKTGVKSLLIERLEKALKDEGLDADEYLFVTSEKKTPSKRAKRGEQDTESETQSNADENHDQDVDDEDELDKTDDVKEETEKEEGAVEKDGVEAKTVKTEPMEVDSETEPAKTGVEAAKDVKTESSDSAGTNAGKDAGSEQKEKESASVADGDKSIPEANGVDNEDSINLTIGEEDEKLLAEEEDSSLEKDAKDEGSVHKKDEAAGAQDKSNDKQASAGEDKQAKTDEQAASDDKAAADKNKSVSQVSGDQKAVKDDKDKKKVTGIPAGSSRNLWVSGLSSSTRATDLKQVFSKYGKVIGAKVVTNARTPGARCYGYVTMATSEDATKCIQHLHRTELHGRMISVERAKGDSTGPPKKTEAKAPIVKKVEEKKRQERKLSTSGKVDEKKEEGEEKSLATAEQAPKDEAKTEVKPSVKPEVKNDAPGEEKVASAKEEDKTLPEKQDAVRERKDKDKPRSADGSHHSRSPHRGGVGSRVSPAKRPGVLTFAQIREQRERQRMRELERELREQERRRREELAKQREIERRNKEEGIRLEREKEKLRVERERIERERAELLRLERERQKLEREKLEREREELKRQQLRLEEARRSTKRPAEDRREPYPEDRKRVATDRRYDSSARFEDRSQSFENKKSSKLGTGFNHHGAKHVNSNFDESRSSRRERDTLVGRTADLPRRDRVSPDAGRGKERFERPASFRSREEHRGENDHRSKLEIRSRDRYPESGKGEGRYTDRSGDTWHSGGGPAPPKPFSSVPSPRDAWAVSDRDRKGDSGQSWGRPMESSGSNRWVSGSSAPMSVVTRGPTMGNPSMYSGPQGVSPSIPGMGLGLGAGPYSGDRFDAYKPSMPLRKY